MPFRRRYMLYNPATEHVEWGSKKGKEKPKIPLKDVSNVTYGMRSKTLLDRATDRQSWCAFSIHTKARAFDFVTTRARVWCGPDKVVLPKPGAPVPPTACRPEASPQPSRVPGMQRRRQGRWECLLRVRHSPVVAGALPSPERAVVAKLSHSVSTQSA